MHSESICIGKANFYHAYILYNVLTSHLTSHIAFLHTHPPHHPDSSLSQCTPLFPDVHIHVHIHIHLVIFSTCFTPNSLFYSIPSTSPRSSHNLCSNTRSIKR